MLRRKGFTLLELLLVIAILAILAAAIGPQFIQSQKTSLEAARKDRFIANYNSCQLAINMFLLASDTRQIIQNTSTYNTYSGAANSGLGLLVASFTLLPETCTYENANGQLRWFAAAVGPGVGVAAGAPASASFKPSWAASPQGFSPAWTGTIESQLRTGKAMGAIWEEIKNY